MQRRKADGQRQVLTGFGVGLTWGSPGVSPPPSSLLLWDWPCLLLLIIGAQLPQLLQTWLLLLLTSWRGWPTASSRGVGGRGSLQPRFLIVASPRWADSGSGPSFIQACQVTFCLPGDPSPGNERTLQDQSDWHVNMQDSGTTEAWMMQPPPPTPQPTPFLL